MIANGHHKPSDGEENGWFAALLKGTSKSGLSHHLHYTVIPLAIMLVMPNFLLSIWYTCAYHRGSFAKLFDMFVSYGILGGLLNMWSYVTVCSLASFAVLIGYKLWALLLMLVVPGPTVYGPTTPTGHTPVYRDNGLACYIITMLALLPLLVIAPKMGFSPLRVYEHFGDLLATEFVIAFVFCGFLYWKGQKAPSGSDNSSSGNVIFDYYWGTELYPRVCGVDIKVYTNCRFAMTLWGVLTFLFALRSYEQHGFIDSIWLSTILQQVYIIKFFYWEAGYMKTIDIMLDRAGFYICWGCLCIVPCLYTSVPMYLIKHPTELGTPFSVFILVAGIAAISLNYIADLQKQLTRSTNGNCLIMGRRPMLIQTTYKTQSGEDREGILLVSGFWGIARHFNYTLEVCMAFLWTVPALFEHVLPYTYVCFLTILLIHRTFRDDEKCSRKYNESWAEYCEQVPYKMIPGVF